MVARHPAALVGTADHHELHVALGAQLRQRLEQRHETLHRDVARGGHHDPPGHAGPVGPGPEHGVIDAHGHDRHPGRVHPHLRRDVVLRGLRHGDDTGQLPGHAHLHAEEPEPSPLGDAAVGVLGVGQREHPVHGDGVVKRGEQRPPVGHHPEQTRSQALVVVDDVEVVSPCCQQSLGAPRECPGLGEPGRAHDRELEQVDRGAELARVRHAEWVGVPVQVETGDGGETHAVVEHGPGLAGEHLHRMAQTHQLARQVARVDTLTATAGIPPVHEVRDPQATGLGRGGGTGGGDFEVGAALPRGTDLGPALPGAFRHAHRPRGRSWPISLPRMPPRTQTAAAPGPGHRDRGTAHQARPSRSAGSRIH